MTSRTALIASIVALSLGPPLAVHAADTAQSGTSRSGESKSSAEESWAAQYAEQRHESHGSIVLDGKRIAYTAVAGTIVIEDQKSEPGAMMSYVAYFRDGTGTQAKRPITFLYNGGPGSATVWLHMGAFGPKRVVAGNGVRGAPAPYPIVDNPDCPLDVTDLVFIDAPGTGFGRVGVDIEKLPPDQREKAAKHNTELKKDFYGVDQDGRAFDIFITKFLTKFSRWNSPKFLFGESYGTTRSAVLAQDLQSNSGIDLNGVMLLSQIFNFDLSDDSPTDERGIDLPYELSLPTYAATAWYHKR
ncbi:MAG: S10 family serine carboxypeptidase-like protein, partial [Steroidobacteraceae bacterium]